MITCRTKHRVIFSTLLGSVVCMHKLLTPKNPIDKNLEASSRVIAEASRNHHFFFFLIRCVRRTKDAMKLLLLYELWYRLVETNCNSCHHQSKIELKNSFTWLYKNVFHIWLLQHLLRKRMVQCLFPHKLQPKQSRVDCEEIVRGLIEGFHWRGTEHFVCFRPHSEKK